MIHQDCNGNTVINDLVVESKDCFSLMPSCQKLSKIWTASTTQICPCILEPWLVDMDRSSYRYKGILQRKQR